MNHSAEMFRCLQQFDVAGIRRLWRHVAPDMPQPDDDRVALVTIHHARTQTGSLAFKERAYSHRWLVDHGYPSGMPDNLRPVAERMRPEVVQGVGISCKARSELMKPIVSEVQRAMEDAVEEAFANGKTDPVFVSKRMGEARAATVKALMGALSEKHLIRTRGV